MKRLNFVVGLLFLVISAYSQIPQGFNYQTVVRDAAGAVLANKTVDFHISLTNNSGTVVHYSENQQITTTSLGIANLVIGGGTIETGTFAAVPWSAGNIFMKVEIKPQGSTTYTNMGSTTLRPVPYAMYALNNQPGPIGPQGPEGKEGPQGLIGPMGPKGDQGVAGTGLTNKGNWTMGASYISGDYVFDQASTGTLNSMWVCKSPTSFISNLQPKNDLTSWSEFQAPEGPQGPQGLQGAPGKDGVQGPIGPQGIKGDKGDAGVGLINKGAWLSGTTYNPNDYVFSTSSANPSLNTMWIMQAAIPFTSTTIPKDELTKWVEFEAPEGQQGIQGIQGLTGDLGPAGPIGPSGLSITWLGSHSSPPSNPTFNHI